MSEVLKAINALSTERQRLWSMSGQGKLHKSQRGRFKVIAEELAKLWHLRRCELAFEARGRVFIEDRFREDIFCDFVSRMTRRPGDWSVNYDELDGFEVRPIISTAAQKSEHEDRPVELSEALQVLGVDLLQEVLAEFKTEARAIA